MFRLCLYEGTLLCGICTDSVTDASHFVVDRASRADEHCGANWDAAPIIDVRKGHVLLRFGFHLCLLLLNWIVV